MKVDGIVYDLQEDIKLDKNIKHNISVVVDRLVVKDGITRVMPVAMPAMTTADRVLELVPEVMDRVENYIDKKKANTDF